MHAEYIEVPDDRVEATGWYVVDDDGKVVAGPFDSEEQADDWIVENRQDRDTGPAP